MLKVIRDLLKYDGASALAFIFLVVMVAMVLLSFVSPYDPGKSFVVAMDNPHRWPHFRHDSRGKDIFW